MVRRRPIQSKIRSSSSRLTRRSLKERPNRSLSSLSLIKTMPGENLDDETRLAKRHLTKEMWQLVSIAVKRMADELVSMSNSQQASLRLPSSEPTTQQPLPLAEMSHSALPLPASTPTSSTAIDRAAGDMNTSKEKPVTQIETIKKRTIPIQMLESSVATKKKGKSNNAATHRTSKSKVQQRISAKKENRSTQRSRTQLSHKSK